MFMKNLIVAVVFTVIIFLVYKFVLNPQIQLVQGSEQCPEGWIYEKPLCKPGYLTKCREFDPSKLSKADKIHFVKKCGVTWN